MATAFAADHAYLRWCVNIVRCSGVKVVESRPTNRMCASMESAHRCDAIMYRPQIRYRNYRIYLCPMPDKNDDFMQTGAAADRLGLGQGPDVPFPEEGRGRGSASARGSSDDEKVWEYVAAVEVYFHLHVAATYVGRLCFCRCIYKLNRPYECHNVVRRAISLKCMRRFSVSCGVSGVRFMCPDGRGREERSVRCGLRSQQRR